MSSCLLTRRLPPPLTYAYTWHVVVTRNSTQNLPRCIWQRCPPSSTACMPSWPSVRFACLPRWLAASHVRCPDITASYGIDPSLRSFLAAEAGCAAPDGHQPTWIVLAGSRSTPFAMDHFRAAGATARARICKTRKQAKLAVDKYFVRKRKRWR